MYQVFQCNMLNGNWEAVFDTTDLKSESERILENYLKNTGIKTIHFVVLSIPPNGHRTYDDLESYRKEAGMV